MCNRIRRHRRRQMQTISRLACLGTMLRCIAGVHRLFPPGTCRGHENTICSKQNGQVKNKDDEEETKDTEEMKNVTWTPFDGDGVESLLNYLWKGNFWTVATFSELECSLANRIIMLMITDDKSQGILFGVAIQVVTSIPNEAFLLLYSRTFFMKRKIFKLPR